MVPAASRSDPVRAMLGVIGQDHLHGILRALPRAMGPP